MHVKSHTPPVIHFSELSTEGVLILNGVAHCNLQQSIKVFLYHRIYLRTDDKYEVRVKQSIASESFIL